MDENLKTARHEAAHATAALHYDLPFEFASIEEGPGTLGTTRFAVSKLYHAIPLFCGPLAEREWPDFSVQPNNPGITLYGGDLVALNYLKEGFGDVDCLQPDAWEFLGRLEVQQQIDRVARALLEHKRLTRDQVIAISEFTERLCSKDWLDA
jgi:hypothetical protein